MRTPSLEARVAALEREIAALKLDKPDGKRAKDWRKLSASFPATKP
jgi:hypothetical protein